MGNYADDSNISKEEYNIIIPDTLGDTLIWGAYEGTLSPERIETPIITYGNVENGSLYATAQTTFGELVVEFSLVDDNHRFSSNKVFVTDLNGSKVNLIHFLLDEHSPEMVFGLWGQQVLKFNTNQAKELLKVQLNRRTRNMDNNVNNDAVAARRRALAEALRTGEPVVVTASGEVEKKEDAADQGLSGIQVPDGKLA